MKQQATQVCEPQPDVNTGHIHSSIILLTEQVSDVQEKAVRIWNNRGLQDKVIYEGFSLYNSLSN